MWILTVAAMLAAGLIAASSLIVARKPNAQQLITKLLPYQGIIGVILVITGLIHTFDLLRYFGPIATRPFYLIISLICCIVQLGLGFMLAYGLVTQYILSGNVQAVAKGEQLRAKLVVYQAPLGLAAIGLAVLFLILSL